MKTMSYKKLQTVIAMVVLSLLANFSLALVQDQLAL